MSGVVVRARIPGQPIIGRVAKTVGPGAKYRLAEWGKQENRSKDVSLNPTNPTALLMSHVYHVLCKFVYVCM